MSIEVENIRKRFGTYEALADVSLKIETGDDELHVASVFVTHDQEEALDVSDRVAIMNHGRIERVVLPARSTTIRRTHSCTSFWGM